MAYYSKRIQDWNKQKEKKHEQNPGETGHKLPGVIPQCSWMDVLNSSCTDVWQHMQSDANQESLPKSFLLRVSHKACHVCVTDFSCPDPSPRSKIGIHDKHLHKLTDPVGIVYSKASHI